MEQSDKEFVLSRYPDAKCYKAKLSTGNVLKVNQKKKSLASSKRIHFRAR